MQRTISSRVLLFLLVVGLVIQGIAQASSRKPASDPQPSGTPFASESPAASPPPGNGGSEGSSSPDTPSSQPSEIANGPSNLASVSSTGRYIAFDSDASNLTTGGNPARDIFVRDTTTRVATLVSANPVSNAGLASFSPDISGDGRYVVFHSFASFDSQDGNSSPDIYVRDLQQNITTLVSRASGASGALANNWSSHPVISADGRFVAFHSTASNLVAGDTNGQSDIFLRDLQTNTTTRVSIADNEDEGNGPTQAEIDISSDGRFIAFESASSNLVQFDNNNDYDVFVRDTAANTTSAMSITNSGPNGGFGTGSQGSYFPSISNDGRYVAFHSFASDLTFGDNNGTVDISCGTAKPA